MAILTMLIDAYEALYRGCAALMDGWGWGLPLLAVITTLLLAPFRRMAGRVRDRHRQRLEIMRPALEAINRESRGRERHERLERLYRRYGYSPLQSLAGAADLFIQLPALILAYYMLSHCEAIRGVGFGPIADLGSPDCLLGGLNFLPILMTLANVAALFTTPGWTRGERLRGLGLAGFFLLLLYAMPAALLIFWTTNNLLALADNLLRFTPWPRWRRALSAAGAGMNAALARLEARAFGGRAGLVYGAAALALATLLILHGPLNLYKTAPDLIERTFGAFLSGLLTYYVVALLAAGYVWVAAPTAARAPLAGVTAFLAVGALAYGLIFVPGDLRLNGFALEGVPAGGSLLPMWLDAMVLVGAAALVVVVCALGKARVLAIGLAVATGVMLLADAVETRSLWSTTATAAKAVVATSHGGAAAMEPAAPHEIADSQVYPPALEAFKKRGGHEIVDGKSVVFLPGDNRLLFGPYIPVRAGAYDLVVDYEYLEGGNPGADSVTFEMINFPPPVSGPFARLPLPRSGKRLLIPGVAIPSGDLAREVEFRFFFADPAVKFLVNSVTLRRRRGTESVDAPEPCYSFSRKHPNHLFVMLDTFDASRIPTILDADPSLRERLDGFAWYTDAMPVGNETSLSVMAMYGGEEYIPRDFNKREGKRWDKAFAAMSRLPREFTARGDRVSMPDFYAVPWLNARYTDASGKPPRPIGSVAAEPSLLNLTSGPGDGMIPAWSRRIGYDDPDGNGGDMTPFCLAVSLFRAAPGFLKMAVYDGGRWLGTERQASSVYVASVLLESLRIGMLADVSVVDDGPGTYNAVFSLLAHAPFLLGPDSLVPEATTQLPDHSMLHALRMLADFFDWMKRMDVYDNTQIILASDHGNANLFGPERPETLEMIARSEGRVLPPALDPVKKQLIRMRALTMRKKFNERGPLREDGTLLMTGSDIPEMLLADEAGDAELTRVMKNPERERLFAYRLLRSDKRPDDTGLLEPFKTIRVRGSYHDYANWEILDD